MCYLALLYPNSGGITLSNDLAVLYAKRFIQRRDVKAVQFASGAYSPDRELNNLGAHAPLGFQMSHLEAHIEGTRTYGHYLLDQEDTCRMFAFDLDLEQTGAYIDLMDPWQKRERAAHCSPLQPS